jgi:L-alanine-DL-glutamate epimerase-like enolase superfamily enzyme
MKINKIESFANEFVGFVRVTAEDGMQGWGQASTYHSDITAQVLHRQVAPWVLGQDTTDLDDLLDLVTEREHKFPGSYLRRAMGGFDTAVWDMRGKRAGKPVAELLRMRPRG